MIVTKAVGLVDTVETEDPNGAFEVVLSAATLDRDGEVIDSRAFDPLPDHIPFDIDHGMTVTTTVGSGTPYYAEDGTLRVKGTFASTALAQDVRTLVAEGHVRTTSVTFMAADRTPDEKGVNHVTSAELLNGTFTPIPSNRESVVLSAKALHAATDEKAGARNSSSDAAALQEAHDIIAGLGASCSMTGADSGEPAKSAPASEEKSTQPLSPNEVREAEGLPIVTHPPTQDADAPEVNPAESADESADTAAEAAESTEEPTDEKAMRDALLRINENAARLAFGG